MIERADKIELQALYEEACKDFVTARDNAKEAIEDAKQHIRK